MTERKRTERAGQEFPLYSESIVETIRESLLILDANLRVLSANRSFYRMFAVKREETEGRPLYELVGHTQATTAAGGNSSPEYDD